MPPDAVDDGRSPPADASGRPARLRRVHGDVAIAIGIIAFCALVYALTLTFDAIPAALAHGMGPAAFPRLLVGVLAVLAVVLAASARGRPDTVREPVPPVVYLTGGTFLAFMVAMWLVGLVPAGFLTMVAIGLIWGERRYLTLVASAAFVCLTVHLLFVKAFAIPLPGGIIAAWCL